jgi:hypothetical protein
MPRIRGISYVVLGSSRYLDSTCISTLFPIYCIQCPFGCHCGPSKVDCSWPNLIKNRTQTLVLVRKPVCVQILNFSWFRLSIWRGRGPWSAVALYMNKYIYFIYRSCTYLCAKLIQDSCMWNHFFKWRWKLVFYFTSTVCAAYTVTQLVIWSQPGSADTGISKSQWGLQHTDINKNHKTTRLRSIMKLHQNIPVYNL